MLKSIRNITENSDVFLDKAINIDNTMHAISENMRPQLIYILEHLCCDFLKEIVQTSRMM